MTELEQNLLQILKEKAEKVIPENIKAGVTILGVTGTYTGENSEEQEEFMEEEINETIANEFAEEVEETNEVEE